MYQDISINLSIYCSEIQVISLLLFSVVKGNIPKVGDTVLVEASYNPNMPFKWSATRVQVLQNQVVQVCNFHVFICIIIYLICSFFI